MRDGQQTTTSEDSATQLLICEALSLAILTYNHKRKPREERDEREDEEEVIPKMSLKES